MSDSFRGRRLVAISIRHQPAKITDEERAGVLSQGGCLGSTASKSPAIRPVVVEAMLRRPERYKLHQSTTLSRSGGEDSSTVPSLWVHAMRSDEMECHSHIAGLREPTKAWFLPFESRSTKADRFAFLACVKAALTVARELLNILGVVTLDEAGIPRLVYALHALAERKEQGEPEALRHFNALVHDLYEALQVKLKAQPSPDALKPLLDRPVPLLRGEQIACINLKDIPRLYVEDDPVRRRFIDGFEECSVSSEAIPPVLQRPHSIAPGNPWPRQGAPSQRMRDQHSICSARTRHTSA